MSNKKIILVTGASSGMGKLSAQDLIKAGHTVYAVARSVDKMKDLEALGAHIMKMDVTNEEDIEKVVAKVIEEQGRIDVLWNNAGYGLYGPVESLFAVLLRKRRRFTIWELSFFNFFGSHTRKSNSVI